ncbi:MULTISPECIES: winged helix-turn-helix transcriptional regulator [unclassified Paenibacillus]|uniref:winged helix-turn-helix transcriptional regulator n=1 Tax=unclassified Paenibacillus TaxID=185978 RepID=UPI001AE6B905|nr:MULTISPECIES: winged helix-turn-helix transcriptional regulator [unclassified Paenibacillus]MBP1154656.1 DNA-binding HxlR family transcriptional regulator [Paenibacillus sp. PvP091]MBP1169960.1 DNA-binding HxlR family transcriptional regulator [Paenibacillus sp. PvR098]MBP2440988.1 DNA-binding HxlR family transcriptional regulator [Paenibacillus sp. PvP052]
MEQSSLCPRFERGMQIISKRWIGLIIHQLLSGPQRFCTIEGALPNISGRLLSERLKDLEHEGIVKREVFPETPVRIEYSLTDKGLALEPVIREIEQWSSQWIQLEMVESE